MLTVKEKEDDEILGLRLQHLEHKHISEPSFWLATQQVKDIMGLDDISISSRDCDKIWFDYDIFS